LEACRHRRRHRRPAPKGGVIIKKEDAKYPVQVSDDSSGSESDDSYLEHSNSDSDGDDQGNQISMNPLRIDITKEFPLPQALVARMLVDHLVDFAGWTKGDEQEVYDKEKDISILQFVERQQSLTHMDPEMMQPDFAQDDRLPRDIRTWQKGNRRYYDGEDLWKEKLSKPFQHLPEKPWIRRYSGIIEELLTGTRVGSEPKNLKVGKDVDISRQPDKQHIAEGQVVLDIDSVLAILPGLDAFNSTVNVCLTPAPYKNLHANIHLTYKRIPIHYIPHIYVGSSGIDPKYDIFILLPDLYNREVKRTKGNLHNHVSDAVHKVFLEKCFLPAVSKILGPNEAQSWKLSYDVIQANSTAAAKEGNKYSRGFSRLRRQEIRCDLDKKHLAAIWAECHKEMVRQHKDFNQPFHDYKIFINAKGYKHSLCAADFPELMQVYKAEVSCLI